MLGKIEGGRRRGGQRMGVGLFVTDWVQDGCCDVYLLLGYKLLLDFGGRSLSA